MDNTDITIHFYRGGHFYVNVEWDSSIGPTKEGRWYRQGKASAQYMPEEGTYVWSENSNYIVFYSYGYTHSYLSLNDFGFPPSFTGKGKLLGPNFEGVEVYWIAPNS